jgi:hypothetical protein
LRLAHQSFAGEYARGDRVTMRVITIYAEGKGFVSHIPDSFAIFSGKESISYVDTPIAAINFAEIEIYDAGTKHKFLIEDTMRRVTKVLCILWKYDKRKEVEYFVRTYNLDYGSVEYTLEKHVRDIYYVDTFLEVFGAGERVNNAN